VLDFARRLTNEARHRRDEAVQDRPDDLPFDALPPLSPGWATTLINHEFARLEPLLQALESRPGPTAESQADKKQEARDKWIYKQSLKGREMTYKKIAAELNKIAPKKGWEPLNSIQGVRARAILYAQRHGLQPPGRRQDL
jgi:hypothetical protein